MLIIVYDVNVLLIVLTTQRDDFDKKTSSWFKCKIWDFDLSNNLGKRRLCARIRVVR